MAAPQHRLKHLEQTFGVQLSLEQKAQVRIYLNLLRRWNRRINLTSLESVADQLRFHFFEAFWAADRFLEQEQALADVGSGAGFPGLAMKLYLPSLRLTLVEKSAKKIIFLKEASRALSLSVQFFRGKAEVYPAWDGIEVATVRGLTPSPELIDLLRIHRVKLLLLHGSRTGDSVRGLQLVRSCKVPASTSRFASLYRC